jgi:protein-tyrosine-phosphatase
MNAEAFSAVLRVQPRVEPMKSLNEMRPGSLLGPVRRLIQRVRRYSARARIASLPLPHSVLFICRANLCRSPYGAAALRRALAGTQCSDVTIDSAGFVTERRDVPANVTAVAERRGVDISRHQSSGLTRARLQAADLIVVVEPLHARMLRLCFGEMDVPVLVLGDIDPQLTGERAIPDPMPRADHVFDQTYERIDRCVEELARLLRAPAR